VEPTYPGVKLGSTAHITRPVQVRRSMISVSHAVKSSISFALSCIPLSVMELKRALHGMIL